MIDVEQVLHDYKPLILTYLASPFKLINPKSTYTTPEAYKDDFKQELQLKCIELTQQYDASKGIPFPGYLKVKLGMFSVNHMKKVVEYHTNVSFQEEEFEDFEDFEQDGVIFGLLEEEETNPLYEKIIMDYFPRLSEKNRRIMELYFIDGVSLVNIGRILQMDRRNVHTHKKTAINQLKKLLDNE